jgi:hypothetical protein
LLALVGGQAVDRVVLLAEAQAVVDRVLVVAGAAQVVELLVLLGAVVEKINLGNQRELSVKNMK